MYYPKYLFEKSKIFIIKQFFMWSWPEFNYSKARQWTLSWKFQLSVSHWFLQSVPHSNVSQIQNLFQWKYFIIYLTLLWFHRTKKRYRNLACHILSYPSRHGYIYAYITSRLSNICTALIGSRIQGSHYLLSYCLSFALPNTCLKDSSSRGSYHSATLLF